MATIYRQGYKVILMICMDNFCRSIVETGIKVPFCAQYIHGRTNASLLLHTFSSYFFALCAWNNEPGSSVSIATELRAGRSGIESRWGRDFPPVQTGPEAHPASCKMGTGSFPGLKCGRSVLLTTHPLLVLRSWKSRAIPLRTVWATPGL